MFGCLRSLNMMFSQLTMMFVKKPSFYHVFRTQFKSHLLKRGGLPVLCPYPHSHHIPVLHRTCSDLSAIDLFAYVYPYIGVKAPQAHLLFSLAHYIPILYIWVYTIPKIKGNNSIRNC